MCTLLSHFSSCLFYHLSLSPMPFSPEPLYVMLSFLLFILPITLPAHAFSQLSYFSLLYLVALSSPYFLVTASLLFLPATITSLVFISLLAHLFSILSSLSSLFYSQSLSFKSTSRYFTFHLSSPCQGNKKLKNKENRELPI